jgi:hypothetical protein
MKIQQWRQNFCARRHKWTLETLDAEMSTVSVRQEK